MTELVLSPVRRMNWRYLLDLTIRFSLGLTFAFGAGLCLQKGMVQLRDFDPAHPQPGQIGQILSVLAIGLYTLMIGCVYILRLRPVSKFAGAMPCAAAILGGFLMSVLPMFGLREDLPLWARVIASVLVVIGNVFAIVIILRLGRSFSILPEGRRLVTQGPYSVVRHPLYLAEAVATLGVVINFLSPWTLLLVVAQLGLQMVRIHFEEKVLKETFPEYEEYAKQTWRLIPGVY
jgi:protein-S-isoprenylcysteine O-methyltransferase Ste14